MKKSTESITLVRRESGYYCVPANPANWPLLARLFGTETGAHDAQAWLQEPVAGATREECLGVIREVAREMQIGVRVARRELESAVLLLTDQAALWRALEIDLTEHLRRRGFAAAGLRWEFDGHGGKGALWMAGGKKPVAHLKRGKTPSESECESAVDAVLASLNTRPGLIWSLPQLLQSEGEDTFSRWGRSLYKATDCGPWVTALCVGREHVYYQSEEAKQTQWWPQCYGVLIGSIVEGADAEAPPEKVLFPFTQQELEAAIDRVDQSAQELWDLWNTDESGDET